MVTLKETVSAVFGLLMIAMLIVAIGTMVDNASTIPVDQAPTTQVTITPTASIRIIPSGLAPGVPRVPGMPRIPGYDWVPR